MNTLKFVHYQTVAKRKGFELTRNKLRDGYCACLPGGACVCLDTDADMIDYVTRY